MIQKLTHYLSALLVLTTSAFLYNATMAEWLKPPTVQKVPEGKGPTLKTNDSLSDLFSEGDWQRGLCKRLQTADGVLLFQNWEQIEKDTWKLWPITLVVGRGMSDTPQTDPIILNAGKGAEIQFTESLDVMSGDAPPIRRGRMNGLVEIRRPATKPNDKPLLVRTANVGIDNQKIWTTEAVHLQMGDTEMVGRDLTLHLAKSAMSAGTGSGTSAILDRMELIYLDKLVIPLEDGPLWQARQIDPRPARPTRIASNRQAQLSLTCNGSVEYDFAIDQLSLYQAVTLMHDVDGIIRDRFTCETLEMRLRNPSDRQAVRNGPLDWLDHIHATGSPVSVNMPSFDLNIGAEVIDLDAVGGLLTAEGSNGITIQRGPIQARLTIPNDSSDQRRHPARMAYQYDPARPKEIGTIDTFGAGIVKIDGQQSPVREVSWKERFKLQPIGATELKSFSSDLELRINGDIQAKFADGGSFRADAVEGVMKPANAPGTDKYGNPKRTLRPDWLQATGDVRIDNSSVAATTERLVLFFLDNPVVNAVKHNANGGANNEQSSIRRWVAQPGDDPKDPVSRSRPEIRGDLVVAQLSMVDGEVHAKDLSVRGGVKLDHTLNAGGQMLPIELTGSELRLSDDSGKDILYLGSNDGRKSQFKIGDGFFIGPLITISPSDNIVRIEGAGEFQMPRAVLPQGLSPDESDRIQWTEPPFCKWNGEMEFNGKTAVLTDGVDITAQLIDRETPWSIHMLGGKLKIVLLKDVKVGEMESMKAASIQQVTLLQSARHPVIVEAVSAAPDGVVESRHIIRAPRLSLMPSGGGRLIGAGPGAYHGWMHGDSLASLADNEKPDNTKKSGGLHGVHLMYHDSMQADLLNKTLAFLRGVRIGMGPVASWEETINARNMDSISNGQATIDCDELQMQIKPGYENSIMPTPWEMQAQGGVIVRTRNDNGLLETSSESVAYVSDKDLFTMRGSSNRDGVIRNTQPNGKPGSNVRFSEIALRLKTRKIDSLKMKQFSMGELPTTNRVRPKQTR